MARPIPDISIHDYIKIEKDLKPKAARSAVDTAIDCIKSKSSKNFVLGTICGWFGGLSVAKVGKIAAFGLGGGILMLHFASEWDYIHVNWEKVRQAVGQSEKLLEKFLGFVKRNNCFAVGFSGGFFFGVASA